METFAYVSFLDIQYVYRDSCDYLDNAAPVGPTVDDLVAAVVAQKNTVVTPSRGRSSWAATRESSSRVARPPIWTPPRATAERRSLWGETPQFGVYGGHEPGAVVTMWILDIDGKRGVITFGSNHVMSAEVQAQLDAMVDSMQPI